MLEDNCVGLMGVYDGVDASFAVVNKVSGELLGLFTRPKFEGLGLATVLIDKAVVVNRHRIYSVGVRAGKYYFVEN